METNLSTFDQDQNPFISHLMIYKKNLARSVQPFQLLLEPDKEIY